MKTVLTSIVSVFFVASIFLTLITAKLIFAAPCSLRGDVDCSGKVDQDDLVLITGLLGFPGGMGDLDQNGVVNLLDLVLVVINFGQTLPYRPISMTPTAIPTASITPMPTVPASISPVSPSPTSVLSVNDISFACLNTTTSQKQVVTGIHTAGKYEPPVAANKVFDARTARFEIPADISWGKVVLRGAATSTHMCWAGGYFTTSAWHRLDITWDQSKNGLDGTGTFRNTTAVESFHANTTWTGLYIYNVHDGIRTSNSDNNWTIQHVWLDYIRDDCVEDDHIYSGTIFDSLFDGCYVGISTRPSSTYSAAGQKIKIDKLLLRMEPMPYPYKWDTKSDPVVTASGYGSTPFGYGNVFKTDQGNEPEYEVTNSVFLHEYESGHLQFPPKAKVIACKNNTIIWLGTPQSAPSQLLIDFPGCFTLITDKVQGKNFWKEKVADWHARHPGVGVGKKPAVPGEYKWPRY